jgi:hypothetical protein
LHVFLRDDVLLKPNPDLRPQKDIQLQFYNHRNYQLKQKLRSTSTRTTSCSSTAILISCRGSEAAVPSLNSGCCLRGIRHAAWPPHSGAGGAAAAQWCGRRIQPHADRRRRRRRCPCISAARRCGDPETTARSSIVGFFNDQPIDNRVPNWDGTGGAVGLELDQARGGVHRRAGGEQGAPRCAATLGETLLNALNALKARWPEGPLRRLPRPYRAQLLAGTVGGDSRRLLRSGGGKQLRVQR